MYMTRTSSFRDSGPRFSSQFGDVVTVPAAGNNPECRAEERRISPVVEPPASELVTVERRHGGPRQLHRDAYAAYQRMKAAAEADGISANLLTIVSGYRSVASQRALWEAALRKYGSPQEARQWVAPPGGSAHHTGRAIDFLLGGPNNSENVAQLRRTAAYRWLVCNAARFGFYPYAAEPWHWEYNPPAAPGGADSNALAREMAAAAAAAAAGAAGGIPAALAVHTAPRSAQGLNGYGYAFGQAPVPVVTTARPTVVLDRFDFDQSTVKPSHWPTVLTIARTILARQSTSSPIRTVRLAGHTDRTGT